MSKVKIWVQCTWSIDNDCPHLVGLFRAELMNHIWLNAIKNRIHIEVLNGYLDQMHCLLKLNSTLPIALAMQLIKGESSF